MDAADLIDDARRTLRASNHRFGYTGAEAREARELLVHVLGREPMDDEPIPAGPRRRYERLVARRATGEPMAYIVGRTEFRDLTLKIRRGAFVPRATTEFLAEQAIRRVRGRRDPVAVDLATGIGPVALSVAKAVPAATVYGIDVSRAAVTQARANATALGLRNVKFLVGDLLAPLPPGVRANVVTIHPPYVARNEVSLLPVEVKKFEPKDSLTDRSDDGFGLVRRVAAEAPDYLAPNGWVLVEVSCNVARNVKTILSRAGYRDVRSTRGPMRWTRVVVGRR